MSTSQGTGKAGMTLMIDPADKHLEYSKMAFAVYEAAVNGRASRRESLMYLGEPHLEQFGGGGNPGSQQGFDFDTFRDRTS